MIGNKEIEFYYNNIFIEGKNYKGTQGLWILLTYNDPHALTMYDADDYLSYADILWTIDSMFQSIVHLKDQNLAEEVKG